MTQKHAPPRHNETFWHAIHLLSRPITLGAIATLLVNDHLLRRLWPSWFTGKIGDLAWLFFAPLALAALLAWPVPTRVPSQRKIVGWLAFGLTGAVFVLTKTVPGVHLWLVRQLETLSGFSISLQRDPTDLLALVALWGSWRMWGRPPVRVPARDGAGWVALSLAALLSVANSAAPDYGIDCLSLQGEQITAHSTFKSYASTDGGLSWQRSESDRFASDCTPTEVTWGKDGPDLSPVSQAERAYIEKTRGGNVYYRPGPLDAVTDPQTGNTLYAMGHEGVLVHTPGDAWVWVTVGEYRPVSLSEPGAVFSLLVGEGLLALGFGLLGVSTLSLRASRRWFKVIPLLILWGAWGLGIVLLPPALTTGYGEALSWMLLLPTAFFVLLLAAASAYQIAVRSPGALVRAALVGLAAALLFSLPYLLWALDGLPNYTAALLFALGLGAGTLLLGDRWARPLLRSAPAPPATPAPTAPPSDLPG